jgi:anti-sigma B factor antagonist
VSKLLEVSEDERAEARLVRIRGELDLNGADAVRASLEHAATEPNRPLIIDLSACTFIDSTGLATIVHDTRPIRDAASVTLVCPQGEVRKLLEISALNLTFAVVDRLEEAPGSPTSEG